MNKSIKIVGIGVVAAVVTFFALLLAGLGTTGLADSEGNWVSMTTVKLGVNEFGLLMILVVFVSVVAAGFVFNAVDKKIVNCSVNLFSSNSVAALPFVPSHT